MKKVVLFEFGRRQIPGLLGKLNMEIDKLGHVVHKETKEIVECHICNIRLTKKNVGNVMPGSSVVLCDNPSCFAQYSSEKNLV